jgi:hypothetical protein
MHLLHSKCVLDSALKSLQVTQMDGKQAQLPSYVWLFFCVSKLTPEINCQMQMRHQKVTAMTSMFTFTVEQPISVT